MSRSVDDEAKYLKYTRRRKKHSHTNHKNDRRHIKE